MESETAAHAEFLSRKEVVRLSGLSASTIDRQVAVGEFPKPYRLSRNRVGWRPSEVQAWIDARPRA